MDIGQDITQLFFDNKYQKNHLASWVSKKIIVDGNVLGYSVCPDILENSNITHISTLFHKDHEWLKEHSIHTCCSCGENLVYIKLKASVLGKSVSLVIDDIETGLKRIKKMKKL